ncbi:MAG: hypothetical protein QXU64_05490 [Thermofilaceae archaeon]
MPTTYTRQLDQLIASFLEGLIAPYAELASSTLFLALNEVLRSISTLSPIDASRDVWLSTVFLTNVVLAFTILDLLRNIVFDLIYPGNAIAEAIGAAVSLLLLARVAPPIEPTAMFLAEIFRDTYRSIALTIETLLLGPLIRYVVPNLIAM